MYKIKRFSYSVVVGGGGGRVDIKFRTFSGGGYQNRTSANKGKREGSKY